MERGSLRIISCLTILEALLTGNENKSTQNYLTKHIDHANEILSEWDIEIDKTKKQLVSSDNNQEISKQDVQEILSKLSLQINQIHFDFDKIVKRVVEESVKIIKNLCSDIFENIPEIKVFPSCPFKEDWSANFDISFQAGISSHELTIVYPQPYQFTPAMKKAAMQLTSQNLFASYLYRCIRAPCHEIIHILQSIKKQEGTDPWNWSAEHDASYISGSLCYQVIKHLNLGLHESFFGELVMIWELELIQLKKQFFEQQELYRSWCNYFGLNEVGELPPGCNHYFKDCIAFENMSCSLDVLQKQLFLCFRDREGNVRKEENVENVLSSKFEICEFALTQ